MKRLIDEEDFYDLIGERLKKKIENDLKTTWKNTAPSLLKISTCEACRS